MIHFLRTLLQRLFRLDSQYDAEIEEAESHSSARPPAVQEQVVTAVMVYVSVNGQKYHTENCQRVIKSKTSIKLEEAVNRYEPCKICNPPTTKTVA